MDVYSEMGYGTILIIWGVIFEVVGFVLVAVIYQAIQRDQEWSDRTAENKLTWGGAATPPVEVVGAGPDRERAGSRH